MITRHIRDWNTLDTIPSSLASSQSSLSILIPARNEEDNIGQCIESVLKNNYTKDNYQIIIIDDHSEDKTVEICKNYVSDYPLVQMFSLPDNQVGKKAALKYGTEKSKSQIIMTLDADSTISPSHLQTITSYFNDPEKMIFTGPVEFFHNNSFTKMMAMELAGLMVITGAGYVNKWHHLANGTNMAFRRDQFDVLGGYDGSENFASGDDMFLMNKYKTRFPKATGFIKSKDAIVSTKAPQNIWEFYRQRLRWSTKNKGFPDRGMKVVLIITFLTSLLIPVSLFLSIWGGFPFIILSLIGFLVKSIADYQLVRTGAEFFDIKGWRIIFLQSELFQIFYVVAIGITSLFKSEYIWKGRSVK